MLWTQGAAARETLSYLDWRGIDAEPALLGAGLSRSIEEAIPSSPAIRLNGRPLLTSRATASRLNSSVK